MKTYSVKEISALLGTSEETVRRWIRDGKLEAENDSKKKGENKVVLESALKSFVEKSPRYAASMTFLLPFGGLMAGSATGALLALKMAETQRLSQAKIGSDSVCAFLLSRINEERVKLESLLTERKNLDKKIQIETDMMNQLIAKLRDISNDSETEEINVKEKP